MIKRYSLKSQIAEVERELEQREKSYPSRVKARAMRQEEADHHIGVMRSVLATLQWLAKHEDAIKGRIADDGTREPEGR